MTSIAHGHGAHAAPPSSPLRRYLLGPGWIRALWMAPFFALIGYSIVIAFRWWGGYEPLNQTESVVTVAFLTAMPFGFLAGIGAFDTGCTTSSASRRCPRTTRATAPTRGRTTSGINTDHKVIESEYVTTTIFFFLAGGLLAMLVRAELARPGMQFTDTETYNGLFSAHASSMIFLFVIPAFAGLANYVLPLMIGAPDMAFPRLNALSYWMWQVDRRIAAAEIGRVGGRVGEDHEGRFQALGAVDGHHPDRIGALGRVALDFDVAAREPGVKAVERRRFRCARTRAPPTATRRSGRAPRGRAGGRACAGPSSGPDRIVSRKRDGVV